MPVRDAIARRQNAHHSARGAFVAQTFVPRGNDRHAGHENKHREDQVFEMKAGPFGVRQLIGKAL